MGRSLSGKSHLFSSRLPELKVVLEVVGHADLILLSFFGRLKAVLSLGPHLLAACLLQDRLGLLAHASRESILLLDNLTSGDVRSVVGPAVRPNLVVLSVRERVWWLVFDSLG